MTVGIVGLGLIGGSFAKAYHAAGERVLAQDIDRDVLSFAVISSAVDEELTDETMAECDLILLAVCPAAAVEWLRKNAPKIASRTIVIDCCGTKRTVCAACFPIAAQYGITYLGGHPMAGSEKTGYESSTDHLLENEYYIITPTPHTPASYTDRMVDVAKAIGALPLVLDYHRHDFIVAAISHLPHLIASSLVNLVHDCDSEDQMMKRLAAGGFKDITRIASSSPVMWEQICMTNTGNITEVLDRYIDSLTTLREELSDHQSRAIYQLFESSRDYRNSFAETPKGSIQPEYTFSADVVDEPGAISIISSILSGKGISIKNIGISHNREHGEGALRISFYDKASMEAAWARLKKYNYTLFA